MRSLSPASRVFRSPEPRAACGVGFVASTTGEARHEHLQQALKALVCVEHRGGCAADRRTGDGAGILAEIPYELLGHEPGSVAVGTLFFHLNGARRREALEVMTRVFEFSGLDLIDWRDVPTNTSALGRMARDGLPLIQQVVIRRPEFCRTEASFATLLYYTKQALRAQMQRAGFYQEYFFASLSTRTIVYKALTTAEALPEFYPDLNDPRFATRFALFHRRFSTNTAPTWSRTQPFRMIAHNGEINTIACNRAWGLSREQALGLPSEGLLTHHGISDSGSMNEMVEALRFRGSIPNLPEVLAIMMPPAAFSSNEFYKFWSRAMEPWDGPAFMAYSDGDVVGARLDRNGFRPCRWARTQKAFYLASEAGIFDLDETEILAKGSLHGGSGAHVVLNTGEVHFPDPSQSRENRHATFDPRLEPIGETVDPDGGHRLHQLKHFGVTQEDLDAVLIPMITSGKEPIGSMGDTARPAVLSDQPRSFFDHFYQTFAQVTNPPMDALREGMMTDLTIYVGRRPNVFAPKTLIPVTPAIELKSPVITPAQLEWLSRAGAESPEGRNNFESVVLPATFARVRGTEGLQESLNALSERAVAAINGGCSIIVLSDRMAKYERPAIPSLLALRAASLAMRNAGRRLDASIVIDTGDVRTTHHLAALVAFGAAAVCPYLAFDVAESHDHPKLKQLPGSVKTAQLKKALDAGLLKIMSKMGISSAQGYHNAQLFTALGIHREVMETYFPGIESPIGGRTLADIAQGVLDRTEQAYQRQQAGVHDLIDTFQLREHRKGAVGERHSMTARLSKLLHEAIEPSSEDPTNPVGNWNAYKRYLDEASVQHPVNIRHLFSLRSGRSVPLEDVQPRAEILRRFGSGAMSFGAISAESQRDLIKALDRVGGRSGSGEGGENPYYFEDGTSASTKQVASGRFGVTAEYLIAGREIEIKVAQGAKPGEGGQLMAVKVDEHIAKARHSLPGVDLISPPPLHDIYSIEDLRQLIYELKQLKPGVTVVVKLVSGANIGTIAAGVVKAGADVIQVSGGDGGTGAASLSSMKHAGLPWELGLAEVHTTLLEQHLREHCILRVDGGLQTGFDLFVAALLGAEEFGFGKLLLVAEGCIMARVCQKNTCPRGIATHDPKFKKKYRGKVEHVVSLLTYLAEDLRRHLAEAGFSRLDEVVGRGDLLTISPAFEGLVRQRGLDLSALMMSRPHHRGYRGPLLREGVNRLNQRLVEDFEPALERDEPIERVYRIRSTDRATLATLSGVVAGRTHRFRRDAMTRGDRAAIESPWTLPKGRARMTFHGSAGQGFGAFLVSGLDVTLLGEANDSVAKSMSGGRLVVRPAENTRFAAADNAIIGNCAMYGATGGTLFVNGLAGDRFGVRNSGATAVVEGVGLHACEYMTNGRVVILGRVSHNIGAGMTGGVLYLPADRDAWVNHDYLIGELLQADDEAELRALLEEYRDATGSQTAASLLSDWEHNRSSFLRYVPIKLARTQPALRLVTEGAA